MPSPVTETSDSVLEKLASPFKESISTSPLTSPPSTFTVDVLIDTSPSTLPKFTFAASLATGETFAISTLPRFPVVTFPPSAIVVASTVKSVPVTFTL